MRSRDSSFITIETATASHSSAAGLRRGESERPQKIFMWPQFWIGNKLGCQRRCTIEDSKLKNLRSPIYWTTRFGKKYRRYIHTWNLMQVRDYGNCVFWYFSHVCSPTLQDNIVKNCWRNWELGITIDGVRFVPYLMLVIFSSFRTSLEKSECKICVTNVCPPKRSVAEMELLCSSDHPKRGQILLDHTVRLQLLVCKVLPRPQSRMSEELRRLDSGLGAQSK